jgi:hypothetical protein
VAGTREPLTPDGGSLEGGGRPAFSAIVSITNYHPSTDAKHHSVATSENTSSTTFVNKVKRKSGV